LPVTVKTRLGWDDQSIVILDVAKMVEVCRRQSFDPTPARAAFAGAQAVFANWSWLEKIKSHSILSSAMEISPAQKTSSYVGNRLRWVMIGRGAIGNPGI